MEATIPEAPRRKLELVFMTGIFMVSLLIATWLTYHLHGSPRTGIDDANIFFSYAENLANGRGLVYGHAGERVEGFTSMLWVLTCALMFKLSGGGGGGGGRARRLCYLVPALVRHAGRVTEHHPATGRVSGAAVMAV